MKVYICPRCSQKYLECDLYDTKCSENQVGLYSIDYCAKCFLKKHKMVKLEEIKKEKRLELNFFGNSSSEELEF